MLSVPSVNNHLTVSIMSVPPGSSYDLSQVPGLAPPPGVIPNFVNPHTRGPLLIALTAVAVGIMYVFVITRLYCKFYVQRKLSWDDCESNEQSCFDSSQGISLTC